MTGGAGFLGQVGVRRLEELGARVRVVRSAEYDCASPSWRALPSRARRSSSISPPGSEASASPPQPGPLASDNHVMGTNVFEQSRLAGVGKLVAALLGLRYPKDTPVPFSEDDLWTGIAGGVDRSLRARQEDVARALRTPYRRQDGVDSCAPVIANLYGPNDNFDLEDSHMIAAKVRKFVEAPSAARITSSSGLGIPSHEFLNVDDAARALLLCAERLECSEPVNVGTATETHIRDLAETIRRLAGF